jgi:hypothetical protein
MMLGPTSVAHASVYERQSPLGEGVREPAEIVLALQEICRVRHPVKVHGRGVELAQPFIGISRQPTEGRGPRQSNLPRVVQRLDSLGDGSPVAAPACSRALSSLL